MKAYAFIAAIALVFLSTSCTTDELQPQQTSTNLQNTEIVSSAMKDSDETTESSGSVETDPVKTNGRDN
jgi:hypothetical protein